MDVEQLQMPFHPAGDKVFLAMGDDVRQCLLSLRWALRNVPPQFTLVLVHIYRLPTMIPTIFGVSMPVSLLKEQVVSAYRTHQRENIDKHFAEYAEICARAKVQVEVLVVENDDVAAGLLDVIVQHHITTLIVGSVRDRRNGAKSKVSAALEKQADPSCNVLFIRNGNLISSRYPASDGKKKIKVVAMAVVLLCLVALFVLGAVAATRAIYHMRPIKWSMELVGARGGLLDPALVL